MPVDKTKTVREEVLEASIEECLTRAGLRDIDFDCLSVRLQEWYDTKRSSQQEPETLRLRLAALKDRQTRLTDALIDHLIDKETFNERKEALLLEEAKLVEELTRQANQPADSGHIVRFLELVKNLAALYRSASGAEKYDIAKSATSNRTVSGKNAYVEPADWLVEVGQTVSALCGPHHRNTDRISIEKLDKLTTTAPYPFRDEARLPQPDTLDHYYARRCNSLR